MKLIEYIKKIGWTALFAMLTWSTYAEAQRLPGVQVRSDSLANAAALVDSPPGVVRIEVSGQELISEQAGTIVTENGSQVHVVGENAQSQVLNQGLASLGEVDKGVLNEVQKRQRVEVVSVDAGAPAVLETMVNAGTSDVADEPNTVSARMDDNQARNYKLILPVNDIEEKNDMMGSAVAMTGKKDVQL